MTSSIQSAPYEIWRRPQVLRITGLSRSSIQRRLDEGSFPAPLSLGGRSVGWRSIDVMSWLDQQAVAAGYNVEGK